MVVYVDVLIFINAIFNYAILATSDRLLKRNARLYRLLLATLAGAAFSLAVFVDSDSRLLLLLLRLLSSLLMTLIAFGWKSRSEFLKAIALTFTVSLLYCGFIILFYQIFKPPNMVIVNDVPYLQVNPLVMIGLTAAIYIILLLLYRLLRERLKTTVVSLHFTACGQTCSCVGKIDTGCNLVEPFSASPVIIADKSVLTIGDDIPYRIVPYSTVGASSYLRSVIAQDVTIDKKPISKNVYIAVADLNNPQYQAVINPDIVR